MQRSFENYCVATVDKNFFDRRPEPFSDEEFCQPIGIIAPNCYMDEMKRRDAIRILRNSAPELASRYGVVSASIFGSVARDEADDTSDLDVAVRFSEDNPIDPMALCGVSGFLSGIFQVDVDVVSLPPNNPDLATAIERESAIAF